MVEDIDSALEIMYPFYEWPSVRLEKCKALYLLARQAQGPIVELGAFDGNGTIALALGAKDGNGMQVYGVDRYEPFTGMFAQKFHGDADREQLHRRAKACGVSPVTIKADCRDAADKWEHGPVSLLLWDLSLKDRLFGDWLAWRKHIAPGGLFLVKDLTTWGFGYQQVLTDALEMGWSVALEKPEACLWGVRRNA